MTDKDTESARNAATMTALMCMLVAVALLILLTAMVMPAILGLVLVVAVFPATFALHYIVWGWWLSALVKPDKDESRESSATAGAVKRDSTGGH